MFMYTTLSLGIEAEFLYLDYADTFRTRVPNFDGSDGKYQNSHSS